MVCLLDEPNIQATVTDVSSSNTQLLDFKLYPDTSVRALFENISDQLKYERDKIELTLQNGGNNNSQQGETILLNDYMEKLLSDVPGLTFDSSPRIFVSQQQKGKNMNLCVGKSPYPEEELMLGASASPTAAEAPPHPPPPPEEPVFSCSDDTTRNYYYRSRPHSSKMNVASEAGNYVGLVNQAMTCYLNSLLQALYMTPEFRNALYNWEFDGSNPGKSIPFQLQRLFLNLQTSSKSAVETTNLTHSFGWNMQEAWEQHDIQELCRVMFDALEQKFKDTKQANLINDLYEGKMLDYVKCLECNTEKSREDTFQDIPLPVRPFGSKVAYNSVEEALRAFVQPETLEGNNQYFCERCDKKCDAHKGLKFMKFPYLLTLHLKRFDFDYSTMNRIKLNDKVVFPEKLNLNSFIPSTSSAQPVDEVVEERETVVKCDDCSTTDSGSALDDESCHGTDASSTVNGPEDNCQDDDEGIDVSSGNTNHHENEKNRLQEPKGPYIYELFSIMIHSGSASGGHYYAYIKEFAKNQWFCFNDQTVSPVTEDDIQKTYGGGPQRGYYSGAYTSSTNAYMLMYRQIDAERNRRAYTTEEYPPHIRHLLEDMRKEQERKEQESETYIIKIYCHHPAHGQMIEEKMYIFGETALVEATEDAYDKLKLKDYARPEDCRLVVYNKATETIVCSLEGSESRFDEVASKQTFFTFLMEIKKPDEKFEDYLVGGVSMKVYLANLETEEVDGPKIIWVNADTTVCDLKNRLKAMYKLETVHVVQETYSNQPYYLDDDEAVMKLEPRCNGYKLYVSSVLDSECPDKPFQSSKLASIIDRFVHIIMIDVILPDTEPGTLEMLSIPTLDMNQNCNNGDTSSGNPSSLRVSPQPVCEFFDHSNSEDSSLSDSDRTLVGDAPGDNIALLSSSSNSPADQHMASPTEPNEGGACPDFLNQSLNYKTQEDMIISWYDNYPPCDAERPPPNCYFKALPPEKLDEQSDNRSCRVFIDKRTTLGRLKKHLEVILGVPMEYFKLFRHYPNHQEVEWTTLKDTLSSLKDGERIMIKLGRVLKENEYSGKVYYLQPNGIDFSTFWFEWIVAKEQTVASVKREVLLQAKKQHMIDIPYSKCRLRKKTTKNPAKIYLDDEKFWEDVIITNMFEMYVQEIEGPEKMTSSQLALFVRQWHPESLTLGPFHEIVIDKRTVDDVKTAISDTTAIPVEFLEVAFFKAGFPCDMHILDVHTKLDWNPETAYLESYPFNIYDDGCVFYYRDNRLQLKELTAEEKKELSNSEFKRLGKYAHKIYSPKRERALKIYVDTSPKKED